MNPQLNEDGFWGHRTLVPLDGAPIVAACCDHHMKTCLRIAVGRKHTTYIPMHARGIRLQRCLTEEFNATWSGLVEFTPAQLAYRYLHSFAATRHITEAARTMLLEIVAVDKTLKVN